MVSRNGALERAETCYLCSQFRRHRLARSVARPYCTRFFPVGVPERPCVPEMTIQELKQAIVDEVVAINENLRSHVYGNFKTRLQRRTDVNGGHLPDVQKISF